MKKISDKFQKILREKILKKICRKFFMKIGAKICCVKVAPSPYTPRFHKGNSSPMFTLSSRMLLGLKHKLTGSLVLLVNVSESGPNSKFSMNIFFFPPILMKILQTFFHESKHFPNFLLIEKKLVKINFSTFEIHNFFWKI